jgi:signal transduction histidine kinase
VIAVRTLRGRLTIALVLVFVLALAASTLMDKAQDRAARHTGATRSVLATLDDEPYQDAIVLGAFSMPALALIWLVVFWSLRPLARASAEARRAGPHDPQARISPDGLPAEIAPLVDAVNGALDRMAQAVEAERRFTENAAHELRTPLAVLKLRLRRVEQAQRAGGAAAFDWPAIGHDLAQMQRLVSQLLDLARKEHAGLVGHLEVNLARLVREAAAMVLPLAEAQGRALTVEAPDALLVIGQADDLRDAIRNLLENALWHGQGAILVQVSRIDSEAVLVISDQGDGIPAELRERVFERFCKGARTSGSGLGLAIVREVALAHGGAASLLPGPGCRVQVRFKARPGALPLALP